MTNNSSHRPFLYVAMCATILASGCATTSKVGAAASVIRTYTAAVPATRIDWAQVLAKAPEAGGAVDRTDMETVRGLQALQGTPRWTQAAQDNSLDVFQAYAPIIGPEFSAAKRPEVVALLAYAGRKFSVASGEAKSAFPRPRPFLADPALKICVPDAPAGSSYPSGHAGWGRLSAQIIARLEPTHATAILVRGFDYGHSRVVCAVHYPTDIEAGQKLADLVLVRLDGDGEYQRLLAVATGAGR